MSNHFDIQFNQIKSIFGLLSELALHGRNEGLVLLDTLALPLLDGVHLLVEVVKGIIVLVQHVSHLDRNLAEFLHLRSRALGFLVLLVQKEIHVVRGLPAELLHDARGLRVLFRRPGLHTLDFHLYGVHVSHDQMPSSLTTVGNRPKF